MFELEEQQIGDESAPPPTTQLLPCNVDLSTKPPTPSEPMGGNGMFLGHTPVSTTADRFYDIKNHREYQMVDPKVRLAELKEEVHKRVAKTRQQIADSKEHGLMRRMAQNQWKQREVQRIKKETKPKQKLTQQRVRESQREKERKMRKVQAKERLNRRRQLHKQMIEKQHKLKEDGQVFRQHLRQQPSKVGAIKCGNANNIEHPHPHSHQHKLGKERTCETRQLKQTAVEFGEQRAMLGQDYGSQRPEPAPLTTHKPSDVLLLSQGTDDTDRDYGVNQVDEEEWCGLVAQMEMMNYVQTLRRKTIEEQVAKTQQVRQRKMDKTMRGLLPALQQQRQGERKLGSQSTMSSALELQQSSRVLNRAMGSQAHTLRRQQQKQPLDEQPLISEPKSTEAAFVSAACTSAEDRNPLHRPNTSSVSRAARQSARRLPKVSEYATNFGTLSDRGSQSVPLQSASLPHLHPVNGSSNTPQELSQRAQHAPVDWDPHAFVPAVADKQQSSIPDDILHELVTSTELSKDTQLNCDVDVSRPSTAAVEVAFKLASQASLKPVVLEDPESKKMYAQRVIATRRLAASQSETAILEMKAQLLLQQCPIGVDLDSAIGDAL